MAEVANDAWKAANPGESGNFLYLNILIYMVLFGGGHTTNFICFIY
jgi:L-rhamnose-H+ transport protein